MNRILIVILAATCVLAGCKPEPTDASARVPSEPANAPTESALPPIAPKLDTRVAELAKFSTPAEPTWSRMTAKVEVSSIERPPAPDTGLVGFSGGEVNGFSVRYTRSSNPTHEQFRELLEKTRVFEAVAADLNKTVRLPIPVSIDLVDCKTVNAFYDPQAKRIIVCYELLGYFLETFKPSVKQAEQLGNAVIGATLFTFYHESGHGLIDILKLAAVGREEDAADQLATLILIAMGDNGVAMAMSGAHWFELQSGKSKTPFWDEHAFDGQRFYNIVCLIYGSDPKKYARFVESGALPEHRAARCPGEYTKIQQAWKNLLQPHLTSGAAENVDYAPTPAPTPAPAPVADGGSAAQEISCRQVATRLGKVIETEVRARASTMGPDQAAQVLGQLESQLPAVVEEIVTKCSTSPWSAAARKCMLEAPTLADAEKCE